MAGTTFKARRAGDAVSGLHVQLLELSRRPGQALSRQQLLRLVWEHDYLGDSRLVDACVQRLRAKIEDVPSSPTLIRTVRGVGYRLDTPQ